MSQSNSSCGSTCDSTRSHRVLESITRWWPTILKSLIAICHRFHGWVQSDWWWLQICNYTQKTPNIVQNTTSKYTIAIATPTSPYPNYPRPTITLTPPKNCKSDYQTPRRKWERGEGSKRRWQSYARERDELCFISKRSLAKELTLAWGMSLVFSFWFQREPPRRVRNNVW